MGNQSELFSETSSSVSRVIIPLFSSLGGTLLLLLILCIWYYVRFHRNGRILLGPGAPGQYDDEEQAARDEAMYLHTLDDQARQAYFEAKAYQEQNPPDGTNTDISLSQFLSIQEKGVSAWEFEPDLEATNCFVECRTEIAFYDLECCVQTNLPIPKHNEMYYWEAKLYDLPETTTASIGVATKPYPTFRLPGWNRYSVGYVTDGTKRNNQPFFGKSYGPPCKQGDVIGCGYRPRTGTVFFTRNGKKLDDATTSMKKNIFPTIGANGPCNIHVNFGQAGFVFIEANVKKWGLAPMVGTLAPPPAYGSEQGSVLLAAGFNARMGLQDFSDLDNSLIREEADPSLPHHRSDISLANITHAMPIAAGPPSYTSDTTVGSEEEQVGPSGHCRRTDDDRDTDNSPLLRIQDRM